MNAITTKEMLKSSAGQKIVTKRVDKSFWKQPISKFSASSVLIGSSSAVLGYYAGELGLEYQSLAYAFSTLSTACGLVSLGSQWFEADLQRRQARLQRGLSLQVKEIASEAARKISLRVDNAVGRSEAKIAGLIQERSEEAILQSKDAIRSGLHEHRMRKKIRENSGSRLDHDFRRFEVELSKAFGGALTQLAKPQFSANKVFFRELNKVVANLGPDDSICALCGRKFWQDSIQEINEYWQHNFNAAEAGSRVRRVFVPDVINPVTSQSEGFSPELEEQILRHRGMLETLDPGARGNLQYAILSCDDRDELAATTWLDPRLGFVLIRRGGVTYLSLHRLDEVTNRLEGTIIEDQPLLYGLFESNFWKAWSNATDKYK